MIPKMHFKVNDLHNKKDRILRSFLVIYAIKLKLAQRFVIARNHKLRIIGV